MRLLDVINSPWAIIPTKLQEIRDIYLTHLRGEKIDLKAIEAQIGHELNNKHENFIVEKGVAIIPIHGVIAKRGNLFTKVSGGASSELIGKDIQEASENEDIKAIILDIDSPGGAVDGTQELANLIYETRKEKPVIAFSNGTMASAAYWIGAATETILIQNESTVVGSIGVVATHVDISENEKNHGVKTTEITAGKFKRVDSQYAPLTLEGHQTIQGFVDTFYTIFVSDVAKFRNKDNDTVLSEMADGRVFAGQESIKRGLVDGFASIDEIVENISDGVPITNIQKHKQKVIIMSKKLTIDILRDENPEVYREIFDLGVDDGNKKACDEYDKGFEIGKSEGLEQGRDAETKRIKSIEEQSFSGHETLVQEMKFDGKTDAQKAAFEFRKAEKEALTKKEADLTADSAPIVTHDNAPETDIDINGDLPIETRSKMVWDKDAGLRAEFQNKFEVYLAFAKNEASGTVRIFKGGK